jgi:hypothetical protein
MSITQTLEASPAVVIVPFWKTEAGSPGPLVVVTSKLRGHVGPAPVAKWPRSEKFWPCVRRWAAASPVGSGDRPCRCRHDRPFPTCEIVGDDPGPIAVVDHLGTPSTGSDAVSNQTVSGMDE